MEIKTKEVVAMQAGLRKLATISEEKNSGMSFALICDVSQLATDTANIVENYEKKVHTIYEQYGKARKEKRPNQLGYLEEVTVYDFPDDKKEIVQDEVETLLEATVNLNTDVKIKLSDLEKLRDKGIGVTTLISLQPVIVKDEIK